ncbi:hypothetical protein [Streptomyces sp. AVP053U2]|uniref:hypothetical protein n=1 Tax=Streptomyces sp. AVP053U2 TaxID=1737066 RepID=UPI00073C3C4F|nr:hypothetical protein [Streptomyces sp. AVP053U2]ODA75565.1 hypothetical protein APS67_000128 [Streptomyces sp. AVP053U2]
MSDLEKATRDAVAAADNSDMVRQIAAILAAQQLLNAQQQPQPAPVQRQEFNATKWLVIGGVTVSVGLVGAVFAVAVAIGAVSVGILALVLRSMWADLQKQR